MPTARRLHFRERALADVEAAAQWYAEQGGPDLAAGFVTALANACSSIARRPASGSPRWGQQLNISELRSWPLKRFPWLEFYVDRSEHIEVWRVLHSARDIPASLGDPDTPPAA